MIVQENEILPETIESANKVNTELQINSSIEESFDNYEGVTKKIADIDKQILSLMRNRSQLTKLQSRFYQKAIKTKGKSNKERSSERPKSGFNKPTQVPEPFCRYLNIDQSIELPRTHVTSLLYKHIKEAGFLNPEDKREVFPDEELRTLLKMEQDEELKFENFQHYVSRVYKSVKNELSSTVEEVEEVEIDEVEDSENENEDEDGNSSEVEPTL